MTAPAASRMEVNVAASISSGSSASLVRSELDAKAISASSVSATVLMSTTAGATTKEVDLLPEVSLFRDARYHPVTRHDISCRASAAIQREAPNTLETAETTRPGSSRGMVWVVLFAITRVP